MKVTKLHRKATAHMLQVTFWRHGWQPPALPLTTACICLPDVCLGDDPDAPLFCRPCSQLDPEHPCPRDANAEENDS